MTIPSTASYPPPPYPGPSSAFVLPPYETATSLDHRDDSSCLPPYQARTGQRFHPYHRILPVHRGYIPRQEKSFKEFYRSLQQSVNRRTGTPSTTAAPSALPPTNNPVAVPPPVPVVATPTASGLPPPPPLLAQDLIQDPEERLRRLIRRLFLLPEIIRIVRAGLGAALRAAETRF
ncbi:hypothetical protein E4T56_gene6847 [Termitomyces sp. T112]|nr:hypothetical protein E4T56_gene6847 [Termitomyces sp. T112]KAH0590462.1 hypothetical protein H2248_000611 [Termitomyces sp. 'cryptogamus']